MDLNELRASLIKGLNITITEEPHQEVGEEPTTKVVIRAPQAHRIALTDWLEAAETGRLVELSFFGERDRPVG